MSGAGNTPTMDTLFYMRVASSPVGPLVLGATSAGLAVLGFDHRVAMAGKFGQGFRTKHSPDALAAYVKQLEEYFAGRRKAFDFPLDLRGTEFQKMCWRALLEIPYGETRTYSQIASAIGRPQAVRAVGAANGANPIAIVVPCHRVIAADGTLWGYGGGLAAKEWLLHHEEARFRGGGNDHAMTPSLFHSNDSA